MTTPLKPIPEDQKLTTWDLANALEACAKALKDMPHSIIRAVEYEEAEAYTRIETIIKGVNNRLVELEKAMEESEKSLVIAGEEHYRRTSNIISNLNARLAQLPKIESRFTLPYNADEIFKIAERHGSLTDEQWRLVIELAKALTPKHEGASRD